MTFITGVSKFSKVSLFSDLNNLIDLTLDPAYAAVCGYTEADLNAVFAPELPGLDRDEIRAWYNGYDWLGERGRTGSTIPSVCSSCSAPGCFGRTGSRPPPPGS